MTIMHPEKVRQFFFIALLVLMAGILFYELRGFVSSFLGSVTLYVLMRRFMKRLLQKKWKPWLAALTLMLLSLVIIMLPVYLLINMLVSRVGYLVNHAPELTSAVLQYARNLESKIGYKLINEDNVRQLSSVAIGSLPGILGTTFNTLLDLVAMYFILYFMLSNCNGMERWVEHVMPIRRDNLVRIKKEANSMVISNAVGIPLIAVAQGIVGLIGYVILGVEQPFLWFALTCFTSMLPLVGSALAYVPLSIIQFANGSNSKGLIVLLYGLLIIGTTDNIFRMFFQRKIGDVHPLVTVFGVLVGVPLFGFIGLVFGPLMISMFILLLRIYNDEFQKPDPVLSA